VPDDQEIKLEALEDASFFLEPVLYPSPPVPPPTEAERLESMRSLRDALRSLPAEGVEPDVRESTERLASVIDRLLGDPSSASLARQLEELVVADLGEQMDWLARALAVEPFGFDDLPADLRSRLISEDGLTRVVALPSEDVSQVVELRRFVRAVEEVAPDAAGRPVVEAGIGSIVVRSFRLAILIAFASIFGLLLLTLRNVAEAFVVLMPITLAALITVAFGIVFDVRFNMANVVAIPLVLGLGVDSGIHVFVRYKHDGSIENLLDSSTPRAVLLSALTTLAAFGSLSLSGHEGIRGLGILLSVSLLSLLYCTLIVLPAVIVFRNRGHE
jgi:predicted RND superfamily exporter protein